MMLNYVHFFVTTARLHDVIRKTFSLLSAGFLWIGHEIMMTENRHIIISILKTLVLTYQDIQFKAVATR